MLGAFFYNSLCLANNFFCRENTVNFFYFEIQGWGGGGGWGCAITALRDEKILPHRQCLLRLCMCLQCVVALCGAQKLFVLKMFKKPYWCGNASAFPSHFCICDFCMFVGTPCEKCTLSDFLFVQVNWRVWGWIWNSSWSTAKIKKEAGKWSCWGQRSYIETNFILIYSNY